jgi:hypothetical protein
MKIDDQVGVSARSREPRIKPGVVVQGRADYGFGCLAIIIGGSGTDLPISFKAFAQFGVRAANVAAESVATALFVEREIAATSGGSLSCGLCTRRL